MNLKKSFLKFLILFSYLNLLIIFDGNISLRYLYDDIARVIVLGQNFFITPLLIVLLVSLVASIADLYLISKITFEDKLFISYFYNLTITSFSTLFIFYFLRIYDVSRFLLLIFIISCPVLLVLIKYLNVDNLKTVYILPLVIIGVVANFYINSNSSINKALKVDTSIVENIIENDEVVEEDLVSKYLNFEANPDINEGVGKSIKLSENYELKKYQICCFEYSFYENGGKSIGYLEVLEDKIIYITGSGIILSTETKNILNKDNLKFELVNNNLKDIIKNSYVFDPSGWESIKDLLVHNNEMFVSYVEEVSNDCVNIGIAKSPLNLNELEFETLYQIDECVIRSVSPYNAHQSGGKMAVYSENEILLTTGDFRAYSKAQDMNSNFGKILKINTLNGSHEILSLGHRNPQGVVVMEDLSFALTSDHGPKGGDEINLVDLNEIKNYGWPIASYGTHYDGGFREEAPLYKSHEERGFEEPIWYFDYEQSNLHGISDVSKNYFFGDDNYFVATLKGNSIYEVQVDIGKRKVTQINSIKIGERIREIEYDSSNDLFYLILEESPSIGIISNINK